MTKIDLVFNRKNLLSRDGKSLIQIRCYHMGRYRYISTDIRIRPVEWDDKKQRVTNKHFKCIQLNRILDDKVRAIENLEIEITASGRSFSLEMLDQLSRNPKLSFNQFVEQEIELGSLRDSTKRQQRVFLHKLDEFRPNTPISNIDIDFCQRFEKFLKAKGLNPNSIHKEFKNFKKFVNAAINKGLLKSEQNPFRNFRVRTIPTQKHHLTFGEIAAIETLDLSHEPELQVISNIYLFAVYTGLRFNDIIALEIDDIDIQQGHYNLSKRMAKTDDFVLLPLDQLFGGKPKRIMVEYIKGRGSGRIFPSFSNQHVNRMLKVLGRMAKIEKSLKFHSSRHSFATSLLNMGMPIESVQKLMGHRRKEQTQEYADLLNMTIRNQLKSINSDNHLAYDQHDISA